MARLWTACAAWPVRARAQEFGDEGGRHVHFAFSARRGGLACILERLRAAGASPTGPVDTRTANQSLYVKDPEGNVVEVWDYFEAGDGRANGVAGLEQ